MKIRIGKKYLSIAIIVIFLITMLQPISSVDAKSKVVKIKQSYKYDSEKYQYKSTLKAYSKSGKLIWSFTTKYCPLTELDSISSYFVHGNMVYIAADGILYALNKNTGKVKWKSKDSVGAGISYTFSKDGTIYLCGYYGPDIIAINKKGKTLWKQGNASGGKYFWPYKITLQKNKIKITYEGGEPNKEGPFYGYVSYDGKIL